MLLGIIISTFLLAMAMRTYPGGSYFDKNSVGFDWTKNFMSNLFGPKAVNGADNPAKIWADLGMIFLSLSFSIFFYRFSKKIPVKSAANVVKYLGAAGMLCTFLVVTPMHDIMVALASTLFLLCMFYITVFVFKSRLHLFKFLCVLCMLIFYFGLYLYGSGDLSWLPVVQKLSLVSMTLLILGLEYFTRHEDFYAIETNKAG